ncbi:MAG: 1,4-dihydroxy-2-naphthoate octaprenyltransferase [Fluviicola sp.]
MSKGAAWIQAMRLRTLPLSLAGIIAGSAVAYFNDFWDGLIFGLAISTTVLFQILSNLANDLGDGVKGTDNENRVGPERAVQSGVITPKEMKTAVVINAVLSLISAGLLIYFGTQNMPSSMIWFYGGLALLCVAAAITYTVGKRAYGYMGLGDLMVLLFFGGVSVLGVYSLYAKSFLNENILLALGFGLLSTAVLNLNNMRDFHNDHASGKITMVVRMGPNLGKIYQVLLVLMALGCIGQFINLVERPILFLALLPGLFLVFHLRTVMRTTDPKDFDPELKKVALSTFALSLLLFAGLIYVKHYAI